MNLFKSAVVLVFAVAICGCERSQPTAPVATSNPAPAKTSNPTPVELPESTNSIGMKFNLIPAGTFTMDDGDDAHEVTLTHPFKMGVHEVTQAQYEQVMGVNPGMFKGADNPVEMVNWEDAVEFCRKLSDLPAEKAAGNVYRLPTEAQWEYACRAGTETNYSFGDDDAKLSQYAWDAENSAETTHAVGGKKPNAWGLHDTHGNVYEWCQNWLGDYPGGAVNDPTGCASGLARVCRGGSYRWAAEICRSARRGGSGPSVRISDLGFRVTLSPSGQ